MHKANIRNTLLVASTVLAPAVAAPTALAAETHQPLDAVAEKQIQTLARSILSLHEGRPIFSLSKDKQGVPIATVKVDFKTPASKNETATGNYHLELITGTNDGQPNPQEPRLLQIMAQREGVNGEEDKLEVNYSLDQSTNSWRIQTESELVGPNVSSTKDFGEAGAIWKQDVITAIKPGKSNEIQATTEILDKVYNLAGMALHAAAKDRAMPEFLRPPELLN